MKHQYRRGTLGAPDDDARRKSATDWAMTQYLLMMAGGLRE